MAGGWASLAAGYRAQALHPGVFVWADYQEMNMTSTAPNQFLIRASGGVGIGTNNPRSALHVAGTVTAQVLSGNGGGLTGLNANNLSSGTVADGRLSLNVARRDVGNAFTGNQTVMSGNVGIGTLTPEDALLDIEGPTHINDSDLFLRRGSDRNHGLGWYGAIGVS